MIPKPLKDLSGARSRPTFTGRRFVGLTESCVGPLYIRNTNVQQICYSSRYISCCFCFYQQSAVHCTTRKMWIFPYTKSSWKTCHNGNCVYYLLRFYKTAEETWKVDKVIDVPAKKVSKNGVESELNGNFLTCFLSLVYTTTTFSWDTFIVAWYNLTQLYASGVHSGRWEQYSSWITPTK